MFEHITVLLSFIYAIAITHLLSTTTELILARDRVRVSWLLLGWMAVALVLPVENWLSFAPLQTLKHWTLNEALLQFGTAFVQYFTCSLVSMRVEKEGVVDMPAFFARQRPVILGAVLALGLAAMIGDYLDRNISGLAPGAWIGEELLVGTMCLVVALA
ncbi:MAG: hypothetical protein JSR98_00005, partial [Proteobacteria bacterium]|nr:hypothetical protein [Pseudomonadota bacterium]